MATTKDYIYVNPDVTEYIRKSSSRALRGLYDKKDGEAYGVLLYPRWYIEGEGCVVRRDSGSHKIVRADGKTETMTSLTTPLDDGSCLLTPKMMETIYKYVQRGWSLSNITSIPGDTNFLQTTPDMPPHRVIVVVPILPEQITLCQAVANIVIRTVRKSIGASVLLVEAEPGENFRDDTRVLTSAQIGIEIAREEFSKVNDIPGASRSVVIPTATTMLGMFHPEEMKQMLYNTIINREHNNGWTVTSRGEASKDVVRVAGYTGRNQKTSLYAVGEAVDVASVRVISTRIRLLGGDAYPRSEYAFYPRIASGAYRIGDSSNTEIHDSFEKLFRKIKKGLPYKIQCYSSLYRISMLSHAYRFIRNIRKEDIKKSLVVFRKLLRLDTGDIEQLCGKSITDDDIPVEVSSKGLVSSTEGKTKFRKNIGYVVTLNGKDSWVVIGEDPVNGVSVVLPDTPLALCREYRVVPSSYLYRYKSNPTRKAILPGRGANDYLSVWEHSKPLNDKSPIPVIMERCFFGDKNGLPSWKSVDGNWTLRFQKKVGFNGWVLYRSSGGSDTEIRHDTPAPTGELTGSWCGIYGNYMVSAKIQNPLVATGAMVLQDMVQNDAYTKAGEETSSKSLRAETATDMLSYLLNETQIDTPLRLSSRAHSKAITELEKTGTVSSSGGKTVYKKYATEENTLASLRSFVKVTVPHLEMVYCQRMMMLATYPHTDIHRGIRDDSQNHASVLAYFRWLYKSQGFASLCVPAVCSMVATQVFRPPRPRAREEVRLAIDAPIVTYPTSTSQKNRANGFLRTPTNPAYGDMNQFVTFAANEDQLRKMVVAPWHAGGAPTWKPVVPREPAVAMLKAIYRGMRQRADLPMYQELGAMDVIRGIQYGFHRLRVSLFVSIRKGAMVVFAPMVKADYSNYLPRTDEFWFGTMTQSEYLGAKNRFLRSIGKQKERYEPRSRWFVNNSLVGNMISKSLTSDQTIPVVLEMLRETVIYEKLNDCDFLINTRDFPKLRRDGQDPDHAVHGLPVTSSVDMPGFEHAKHLPILGFNVHPLYADIPIPVPDDWKNAFGGYYGKDERGSPKATVPHPVPITEEQWALREPKAVFRGGATGVSSTSPMNQRLLLAEMVESLRKNEAERRKIPLEDVVLDDFDVEVVSAAIRDKKVSDSGMEYMVPSGSSVGTVNTGAVIRTDERLPLRTELRPATSSDGKTLRSGPGVAPDVYVAQDRNQMAIYVDGNAAAYRYSGLMAAGFVILHVASRVGYEMWFYPALTNALPGSDDAGSVLDDAKFNPAGDHILIDADMKNLQNVIHWVRDHPTQAIQIAENSIKKYTKLFRKNVLRRVMADAINLASMGQTWKKKLPNEKVSNVRLVAEPREAKSYRNALSIADKRRADRERVTATVKSTAEQDVVSTSIQHSQMTTQHAPTEGYERKDAAGVVVVPIETFRSGREMVTHVDTLDTLPTTSLPKRDIVLRKPSNVLSKYTHGALRRQVMRFSADDEGESVDGYVTDEESN